MPYEHRNLVMSSSSSMPKNWGWCAQSNVDAHGRKWFRTRKPVMVAHKQMPRSTSRMAVRCRFPTFLFGDFLYIYVHTNTHIYIWYTLSVCELKPSGRRRWDAPRVRAQRARGTVVLLMPVLVRSSTLEAPSLAWKVEATWGCHMKISWVYNQWWC